MSAVPRPARKAEVGEKILFYKDGDPSGEGIPVDVHRVGGGSKVCFILHEIDGGGHVVRHVIKNWVAHVHDPVWDEQPVQNKQNNGAWDFHPIFGPYFAKNIALAKARESKQEAETAAN